MRNRACSLEALGCVVEGLALVEKYRNGALDAVAHGEHRRIDGQTRHREAEALDEVPASQVQEELARRSGLCPVRARRYTVAKFLGGQQTRVAQAGQVGLDFRQHRCQESHSRVAVRFVEGGCREALDLGDGEAVDEGWVLPHRAADGQPCSSVLRVADNQQERAGSTTLASRPHLAHVICLWTYRT